MTVPTCSRASVEPKMDAMIEEFFGGNVDMATFLIDTACKNSNVANFLYWFVLEFNFILLTFSF
jgi:hypothetical protein